MSHDFSNTKGYSWVDNAFLDDERLHYFDVLVYIQLCRHADAETDETFISQKKIAEKIGISRPTVNKAIKHLVELGYIKATIRARKNGGRTTSIYKILDVYGYNKDSQSKSDLQHDKHDEPSQSKSDLQGVPAKVNHVYSNNNINNINNKNNNYNNAILPSNMPKQQSLFSSDQSNVSTEEIIFRKRRGKSRSLEIIELYKQGRIPVTELDMLDLCYYYTICHKQIVGTVVSVVTRDNKSESDLSLFMSTYDLDNERFVKLLPKILETFVELDSAKPKTKRQNKLNIGNLAHSWFMDPIMDKVLPKVNTKYLDNSDTEYKGANPYRQVDEVF